MTIFSHWLPDRLLPLLFVATLTTLGCERKQEIRSYTVEKVKDSAPAATAAPRDAAATDRMLGAIVPAGDQSWFFKVTGPIAAVDKNAAKINEFFQTIQLPAGAGTPVWKTPDDWEELGPSGMRAATLKIPSDSKPLEMSVISSSGTLIDNVNRWRGQMQLPPIDESAMAESVKESRAGDAKMWLVDLRGKASPGGMMAPFAGGAGRPVPPSAAGAQPSADLPPGHPPVAAEGGPDNFPSDAPYWYTAPASWQPQPAGGMRKAAFLIKDGDKQAEVTVIDLVASAPSIADPLQNVNRWRGEIGLSPFTQDQLAGVVQEIKVDGNASNYFELIPDAGKPAESQGKEATIAAAVPAGRMIWFIKMRGDRDLVVAQRDNFKFFLESIRFPSDGGAGDGN